MSEAGNNRRARLEYFLFLFSVFLFSISSLAKMASAFLFKNGFALLQQSFAVAANADVFVLPELPVEAPSHGTFWLDGTAKVHSVHTSDAETKLQERPALTVVEMLLANRGSHLSVLVDQGSHAPPQWFEGVVQVPEFVNKEALPGFPRTTLGSIAFIDGPNVAFPLSSVLMVRGAKKNVFTEAVDAKGIVVRLHAQNVPTTLRLMLLAKNLTWAPSYKAHLGENRLVLSGHACILNDGVKFVRSFEQLTCLAGVPNLACSGVIDPMAQQQQVSEFLNSLNNSGSGSNYAMPRRGGRPNMMSNMMSQQVMSYGGGGGGGGGGDEDGGGGAVESGADDLHQYKFQDVVVPKGSRVMLELFPTVELKYRDVHQAELSFSAYPQRAESNSIDVWHSIKVVNSSSCPWSTGPVLVTRGPEQSLVCQSTVSFVPVGRDAQIKLTKSMAVTVNHDESIIQSDKSDLKKILERSYLKAKAEGSLILRNLKAVAVTLCITVNVTGDLISSTIAPTSNTEVGGSDLANASRVVIFDVELAPKESKVLKYSRLYYVSH